MNKVVFLFILIFSSEAYAQDQLISFRETTFATRGENAPRAHNIRLASRTIGEVVLLPGQEFSYNQIVGPRTRQRGYKKAHVIIGGEITDGYGGGACQVAGTLHAAILEAGLEIVESYQHTRVSAYLSPGFDTTVTYGSKDFRFRNNFEHQITVKIFEIRNGVLRAEVWAPHRNEVSIQIQELVHRGFSTIRRQNCESLRPGDRHIVERGGPFLRLIRRRFVNNVLMDERVIRYNMAERIIEFCPSL